MEAFNKSEDGKVYSKQRKVALRTRLIIKAKFTYLKGMPKKPPSALKMFIEQGTKAEKKANPDMKLSQISQLLQKRWQDMSEEEKKPITEEATKKEEEYNAA